MLKLASFILFQVGWFLCVLSAASNRILTPTIVAATAVIFNLIFVKSRKSEFKFFISAVLFGAAIEFSISQFHLLEYRPAVFFPPPWILALWTLFASTFSFSMNWALIRPVLAMILAFIFGPLSAWSADTLGALTISEEFWPRGYLVLGAHWGAAILGLIILHRYFHKSPS